MSNFVDTAVGVVHISGRTFKIMASQVFALVIAAIFLGVILFLTFGPMGWRPMILLDVFVMAVFVTAVIGAMGKTQVRLAHTFLRWPNAIAPGLAMLATAAWVWDAAISLPVPVLPAAWTILALVALAITLVQGIVLGRQMVREVDAAGTARATFETGVALALGYSGAPQFTKLVETGETNLRADGDVWVVEPLTSAAVHARQKPDFLYRVAECLPDYEVVASEFGFVAFGPVSEAEANRRALFTSSKGLLGRIGEGPVSAPAYPAPLTQFQSEAVASQTSGSGPSLGDLGI